MIVALLALAALWWWQDGPGPPLTGKVFVIDGDTIRVGSTRVRLTGIDAPELDQTCTDAGGAEWSCGERAKDYLIGLAGGVDAACTRSGRDRYGRVLAKCEVSDADLGAAVVRAGWAIADGGYGTEQMEASAAHRGIWAGSFVAPVEWRRTHGQEPGWWEWVPGWFQ